jgi:hypothetical protein
VEQLSSQLTNLKHAMGTLADVVSEEFEHLRRVVISGDLESKIMQVHLKMEAVEGQVSRLENEQGRAKYDRDTLREQIGVVESMEGKRAEVIAKQMDERVNGIAKEL